MPKVLATQPYSVTCVPKNFSVAVALAVVAVRSLGCVGAAVRRWESRAAGVAALAMGLLYLVAPENLGIDFGLINERLSLFPVLFGLLWLLTRPLPARATAITVGSALFATLALGAVRAPDGS